MTEQPGSDHGPDVEEQNYRDMSSIPEPGVNWGRDRLAEVLDTHAQHAHDIGWGDGISYLVGHDPETSSCLEVFPDAGVVRLTSQDARITLFRQPPPSVYADRVTFERHGAHERLDLTLTRRGRLRLDLTPALPEPGLESRSTPELPISVPTTELTASVGLDTLETPTANQSQARVDGPSSPSGAARSTRIAPGTEMSVVGDSGKAEGSVHRPFEPPEAPATTPESKPERLHLAGRLGRGPSFRTTRNGALIASFPLAVRDDAGETTWHSVLAFGARAEKLQEGLLAKGQHIEVIGYLRQREFTTRSGETRIIDEIYAAVVKPR